MSLAHLIKEAERAYHNTSHFPERGAKILISDLESMLNSDIEYLEHKKVPADAIERYKAKFEAMARNWIAAKSRCISSFITGPANFPVRRAEKANASEQNRYNDLQRFREKAKKAMTRVNVTVESELEKAQRKLNECEKAQEIMKACNKVIRKNNTSEEKITELSKLLGNNTRAIEILKPDFCGRVGFASYALQNNNAAIKRWKERVSQLSKKVEIKNSDKSIQSKKYGDVELIQNFEIDRLQIVFPSKPERETITKLKLSGWRWSPKNKAWQRKNTNSAIYSADSILKDF